MQEFPKTEHPEFRAVLNATKREHPALCLCAGTGKAVPFGQENFNSMDWEFAAIADRKRDEATRVCLEFCFGY